jgi:hypothetical protein
MIDDPISMYRAELRTAAVRRAGAYERRRRATVGVAVVLAAALIVSGAIAAQQTRWFNTPSVHLKIRGVQRQLDQLERGYVKCVATHAASPACKPLLEALVVTCLIPRSQRRVVIPRLLSNRVMSARAAACLSAARRGAALAR